MKGNSQNLERVRTRLEREERLYLLAQEAIKCGDMGADRWYQYREKTVVRLRELVSIMENNDIEDGAQIKLRGNDFSHLRRVVTNKALEMDAKGAEEAKMLAEMTRMLGGGFG